MAVLPVYKATQMKRIAVLTAGGDTPALNATISGVVARANQLRVEVIGIIKGFNGLLNPEVPHVHLNPLYATIPALDSTLGGTMIGTVPQVFARPSRNSSANWKAVFPTGAR